MPLSQRGSPWCARFQSTRPCRCHRWHLNTPLMSISITWCCTSTGASHADGDLPFITDIYHVKRRTMQISEDLPSVFTHDITYHMTHIIHTHAITYRICHHANILNDAIKCCPKTRLPTRSPSPAPQPGSRLILSIPVDKGLKYFPFSAIPQLASDLPVMITKYTKRWDVNKII